MVETMLNALTSWRIFLLALLVWGFAPGLVLRLICLAFPRHDPRRRELRAELFAVPRLSRPFWVFEQLEVALVEGLGQRAVSLAEGRVIDRWHLASGVDRHRAYPKTFWIPSNDEKAAVQPGVAVKLEFRLADGWAERMWVEITSVRGRSYTGRLRNRPVGIPRLRVDRRIKFRADHILDIDLENTVSDTPVNEMPPPLKLCKVCGVTCSQESPGRVLHEVASDDETRKRRLRRWPGTNWGDSST